jgi:hypothetical protein
VVRTGAEQMKVQMSQYDNYRDDEIIDKVDNEYTLGSGGFFHKEGVGYATVRGLPISPTLVPTPQPLPPKS